MHSWVCTEDFTISIVCASCLNIHARLHAECACGHDSVRCSIGCSGNLVQLILTSLPLLLYVPPPSPSFFMFHLPSLLSLCSTSLPFFLYVPPPSPSFFMFHLPPLLSLHFTSLPFFLYVSPLFTSLPLNLYIPPSSLYFFVPPFSNFFPSFHHISSFHHHWFIIYHLISLLFNHSPLSFCPSLQ